MKQLREWWSNHIKKKTSPPPADYSTISKEELLQVVQRVYDFMERTLPETIELEYEFYWSIEGAECYAIYEEAPEALMNDHCHEWECLRRLLDQEDIVLSYDLVWLSGLLRALNYQLLLY